MSSASAAAGGDLPVRPQRLGGLRGPARLSAEILLVAGALALAGFLLVQLLVVVLPVIAALFLATLLVPLVRWLRRRGWPDALASLVVLLAGTAVLAGLATAIGAAFGNRFDDLLQSARAGVDQLLAWLAAGPLGLSAAELDRAVDSALAALGANSQIVTQGLIGGLIAAGEVVAGLLLTLAVLFFLLRDGERIWVWTVGLFPAERQADVSELGKRTWATLGSYVRGTAVVGSVNALLTGLALLLIGVPLVLPLMALVFLAAFFPIVGIVVAGLIAALVALVSEGPFAALLVVAAITAIQQLEGDLLFPLVVGRAIRLHPLAILLVLTGGTVVGGIVGALLAVPLAAVAWTVASYVRKRPGEPKIEVKASARGGR